MTHSKASVANKHSNFKVRPVSEVTVDAMYNRAIGIDVHHSVLVCCFQYTDSGQLKTLYQEFGTSHSQLQEFASWCKNQNPEILLMESTGVLWISPYEALEDIGFSQAQIALINAREVKAMTGKKTDTKDAARLARFARLGDFHASFVPSRTFRKMRLISRSLCKETEEFARAKARFVKQLNATGCRATAVFSDIYGKAANIILEALIDPEKNLAQVIQQNSSRLKKTPAQIYDALRFAIDPSQVELIRLEKQKVQSLENTVEDKLNLLREIQKPYKAIVDRLMTIPTIKEKTARILLSEITDNVESFKSIEKFCSWLGLCPGNNESAKKEKKGTHCPKGNKWVRKALVEAAQGLSLIKTSPLRKRFLAYKLRRGRNKAIFACAHMLARIIYCLLKNKIDYVDRETNILKTTRANNLAKSAREAAKDGLSCVGVAVIDNQSGEIVATG